MRNDPHDRVNHDSINGLGYDWGKVGYPKTPARRPFQVYFPEDEQELKDALAATAGKNRIIRAQGHSNNNLVLGQPEDPVICLNRLNKIAGGKANPTITQINGRNCVKVEAGCELGAVEDALNNIGKGLPIMPDHRHITAGGIASAGGVNSACHLHGLFIDNISGIELIEKDTGQKIHVTGNDVKKHVGRTKNTDHVMLSLDLDVLDINKRTELLQMHSLGGKLGTEQAFIDQIKLFGNNPNQNDEKYFRGSWFSLPGKPPMGAATTYIPINNPTAEMWLQRGDYVHRLDAVGKHSGTLPPEIEKLETALKLQNIQELVEDQVNPQTTYQTYEDVELFTDRVIDMSVGTPTAMFAMFVPQAGFETAFKEVNARFVARQEDGEVVMFVIYSRIIDSEFLRGPGGQAGEKYVDISVFVGLPKAAPASSHDLAAELDEVAANLNNQNFKCYRYMCTKTTFDPDGMDPRDTSSIWQ